MSILTDRQQRFLKLVGGSPWLTENFYLGGGTALAEFYLQHRYSEDLDFFTEQEFDSVALTPFLATAKDQLGAQGIDSQQSFNRQLFFLTFEDEVLKTEFTYYPFPRIEVGKREGGIAIDSLIDIAVNKLFTIYQQPRARDYIDLYYIIQQQSWSLTDLAKKAKIKFDWHIEPIQLGTQLLKATETKDYPRLIKKIEPEAWQDFFVTEAGKLKDDILTS